MAYTKTTWANSPATSSPLNATNLKKIEDGLFNQDARITTAETDINNAEAVIGNETDTYSASSTYKLGSLVIYNNLLYKCTTAITVAEVWNSSHWTQTSLTSEIDNLIETGSNSNGTYEKYSNGKLIQYGSKILQNETFTIGYWSQFVRSGSQDIHMDFPIPFISIKYCNSTVYGNGTFPSASFEEVAEPTLLRTQGMTAISPSANTTTRNIHFSYYAVGTWK